MFILRKLTQDLSNKHQYSESNEILGDSYTLVGDHNEAFPLLMEDYNLHEEQIYAFILCKGGDNIPLYRGMQNYIMTSDGKTFSNLTKRTNKE